MRRNTAYTRKKVPHEGALTDHSLEAMRAEHFAVELHRFLTSFRLGREAADAKPEVCDGYRLGQVIAGALLNRLESGVRGIVPGHKQHFSVWALLDDRFQ